MTVVLPTSCANEHTLLIFKASPLRPTAQPRREATQRLNEQKNKWSREGLNEWTDWTFIMFLHYPEIKLTDTRNLPLQIYKTWFSHKVSKYQNPYNTLTKIWSKRKATDNKIKTINNLCVSLERMLRRWRMWRPSQGLANSTQWILVE